MTPAFAAMIHMTREVTALMLELIRLSKRYGATVALDDLGLTVTPGTMLGFVGTNGAGKTTAMRIVMGVLTADSGEVRWQGRPVTADARRGFGYMPEERGLYPRMRVLEQLSYLAQLRGVAADTATETARELIERLGVSDRGNDRVESLSLGNQQRVQLAAALVHRPELLVLDEPFSGLDPVGVDALAAVLREQVDAGVGVIFSSHQLDLVERLCDEVAIIRAGRIVASGPVDELRTAGRARQLKVRVDGAPDWARGPSLRTAGVRVVSDTGHGAVVVEIPDQLDDQVVLDAARAAGAVREFVPAQPTLSELFREVVTDPSTTDSEKVPA